MHTCLTLSWNQEGNIVAEIPKIIEKLNILHLHNMIHTNLRFLIAIEYILDVKTLDQILLVVFLRVPCSSLPCRMRYILLMKKRCSLSSKWQSHDISGLSSLIVILSNMLQAFTLWSNISFYFEHLKIIFPDAEVLHYDKPKLN